MSKNVLSGISEVKLKASNLRPLRQGVPLLVLMVIKNWKERFHTCQLLSETTPILFLQLKPWDYKQMVVNFITSVEERSWKSFRLDLKLHPVNKCFHLFQHSHTLLLGVGQERRGSFSFHLTNVYRWHAWLYDVHITGICEAIQNGVIKLSL